LVPVLLGLVAATCFGAMTVAVLAGLQRVPDPAAATFVTSAVGFAVGVGVVLVASPGPDGLTSRELWPFLLAGLIAPRGVLLRSPRCGFQKLARGIGPAPAFQTRARRIS